MDMEIEMWVEMGEAFEATPPPIKRTRLDDPQISPLSPSPVESLRDRVCKQIQPVDYELMPGFFGLDRTQAALTRCLMDTYKLSLSANIFLIGQSGTGKTHALRGALRAVPGYRVVELDGKHVTNDVMAARELSRLLCLDSNPVVAQSITDLEADLKAIRDQFPTRYQGSFSDHLNLVLGQLDGQRIIFLLKNFDHLCKGKKNALVYTLLDRARDDGKVVLVGEYCELDCIQRLDKRLRSRMENLTEFNFPAQQQTAGEMIDLFKSRLCVEGEAIWNEKVDLALTQYLPFLEMQIQLGSSVGYLLSEVILPVILQHRFEEEGAALDFLEEAQMKLEHPQSAKIRRGELGREELVLLFTAVYLTRIKKMKEFSFEMMFKHSATIRKGGVTNGMFMIPTPRPPISFVAFEKLVDGRFLAHKRDRRDLKLKTKAPVMLTYDDVDFGLLQITAGSKGDLPLLHWAKRL